MKNLLLLTVASCLLAMAGPRSVAAETAGGWPNAAEIEDFLRRGKIVEREKIGTGITHSRKVTLERGGKFLQAALKRVDAPYDNWRHEVAAYELDKLLGIGMVPPTIKRQVRGTPGCLQLWVEGSTMADPDGTPTDLEAWRREVSVMWLFDDLIANTDRHLNNAIMTPETRLVLIDHSKAFQNQRGLWNGLNSAGTANRAIFWMTDPSPDVESYPTTYPPRLIERLRSVTDEELRQLLRPWVRGFRKDLVLERRQLILERLGQ